MAPASPLIIIHAHTSTRINHETEAAKEQKKRKKKEKGKKIKRRNRGRCLGLHQTLASMMPCTTHSMPQQHLPCLRRSCKRKKIFLRSLVWSIVHHPNFSFFLSFFLGAFSRPPPQHLSLACVYGSKKRREKVGLAGR